MARIRNHGFCPDQAAGKRVFVWLANGLQGKCDPNPMSPPGWAADGPSGCRWSITGSQFDIVECEVIQ
jgi:hypothetical protein